MREWMSSRWWIRAPGMSWPTSGKPNCGTIAEGSPAEVFLQFTGGKRFHGRVVGPGWAVVPEDGTSTLGLPNVPRNLDWVRLAQRFPVRIQIDNPDDTFRVGASAVVRIGGSAPAQPTANLTRQAP